MKKSSKVTFLMITAIIMMHATFAIVHFLSEYWFVIPLSITVGGFSFFNAAFSMALLVYGSDKDVEK